MDEREAGEDSAEDLDGKCKPIGCDRSIVLDVVHISDSIPTFPVERWFDLTEVAAARRSTSQRISWVTLFAKAYAISCKSVPELRRAYLGIPWPRFYQSGHSVVSVAINRQVEGRDRLFFGCLRRPDEKPLIQIQGELDGFVHGDIEKVFRAQLKMSRVPLHLRRLIWWWQLQMSPSLRARRLGTCSISVLAGMGVLNRLHPSVLSSSLSYGPLESDGRMCVTLQCDHRVIDGVAAAKALNLISDHLCGVVLDELCDLTQAEGKMG